MPIKTLTIDLETYCETPIKNGAYRYAEDAEILIVALAKDGVSEVVDVSGPGEWEAYKPTLLSLIGESDRVLMHNSMFDRTVLRHSGVVVPVGKITDTMVIALQHALPASLDSLCELLQVPQDKAKSKAGKKLIHLFCKPRPKNMKLRRADRVTHPAEWAEFLEYARLDVDATNQVLARLPRWNDCDGERLLWRLDQDVNDDGAKCDTELASAALRAFQRAGGALASSAAKLTAGDVTSTTQRDRLLAWLAEERGFEIDNLQGKTVEKALEDAALDPVVRELLENRKEAAATSPSKYRALLGSVCRDGRLRGTIQYAGASRTLRDAGRIFQPQNLPRCPDWFDADEQERTVRAFKLDCEDLLYEDVVDRCSFAIRGCIVAEPGNKLVIADLANIEGRVTAWLAGEEWKLEAFRAYDRGEGHDLYKVTAGRILGKRPEDVTKPERQNPGKVAELAGGFGGSVGAYRKMGGAALESMSDDAVLVIVRAWRDAHPMIRNFWYDMERAAKAAVENPDKAYVVRSVQFEMRRDPGGTPWLLMRKPNGRFLCYRNPEIEDGELSYEGTNQYTRKWERLRTWGGKLCLARGTPVLTDAGWLPIEQVSLSHKVWDGIEWVCHSGLADNGVKEVICAHGVWMTPDHEVLTTEGWVRASQSERHNRAACRLPDGVALHRQQRSQVYVGRAVRLREHNTDGGLGTGEAETTGNTSLVRLPEKGDYRPQEHRSRHVQTQGVRGVAEYARSLSAAVASRLEELRRAWDHCVRSLATVFSAFLGGHGANLPGRTYAGACEQRTGVLTRELCLGDAQAAEPEQTRQQHHPDTLGRDHDSRGRRALRHKLHDDSLSVEHRCAAALLVRPARPCQQVYDLVNCGPRHRFVVASEDGTPLIVHNCENVVQSVARDVFKTGSLRAAEAGYKIVLPVHDELVCEVPDSPEWSAEGLSEIMARPISWAAGLPLAAEGFESRRYRK